jgi:hypothetical protein
MNKTQENVAFFGSCLVQLCHEFDDLSKRLKIAIADFEKLQAAVSKKPATKRQKKVVS